jgi:hypothetical protein
MKLTLEKENYITLKEKKIVTPNRHESQKIMRTNGTPKMRRSLLAKGPSIGPSVEQKNLTFQNRKMELKSWLMQ